MPTNLPPDLMLQEGLSHHQSGNFPLAEQSYQRLIKQHPKFSQAYNYLGVLYMDHQKKEQAIAVLEKGVKTIPNEPNLISTLSAVLSSSGEVEKAIYYAKQVVELVPNNADAYYNLSQMHNALGENKEAIAALQKTIALNPVQAEPHYNLGVLLYAEKQVEESRDAFKEALRYNPNLLAAHINLGRVFVDLEEYEEALVHLEKALSMDPEHTKSQSLAGMCYHFLGQLDKAKEFYLKVYAQKSDEAEIHVLLGNLYRDLVEDEKAIHHYAEALKIEPDNPIAKENLQKKANRQISHWHFAMLADTERNKAFHQAIKKAVKPEHLVLDIGTGSGLLAMMAAKAGAKKVIACEMLESMAKTAQEIIEQNNLTSQVEVLNKKSISLKVGEELPEKADVVISEILDVGLVGEGVIPTMRHALRHLAKPDAIIIPCSAQLRVVLIESEGYHKVNPVKTIEGFDLSGLERYRVEDAYNQVYLKTIPHKKLSEELTIHNFDFTKVYPPMPFIDPEKIQLDVEASADGEVHGIAFWFDLNMDDEITVSSGPDGEMVHWGQATYFFNNTQTIKAGDKVKLELWLSDMMIRFRLK